jgi:hypothetical protein
MKHPLTTFVTCIGIVLAVGALMMGNDAYNGLVHQRIESRQKFSGSSGAKAVEHGRKFAVFSLLLAAGATVAFACIKRVKEYEDE